MKIFLLTLILFTACGEITSTKKESDASLPLDLLGIDYALPSHLEVDYLEFEMVEVP